MEFTTSIMTDAVINMERGKWTPDIQAIVNVNNALQRFLSVAWRDIQANNSKSKTRGMVCSFEIPEKYEIPKEFGENRKFVIRTWEGMGRIVVHVGVAGQGDQNFVSAVGAETGDKGAGLQGIWWDSDQAIYILWLVTEHWWDLKTKFVESKTVSFV